MTTVPGEGVSQPLVFDPSMKQHAVALRAGDPRFTDKGREELWYGNRMVAMAAALKAVADNDFAGDLVLRGSVLMKLWFGADAREPGDLDFVVESSSWSVTDERTDALFDQIAARAEEVSRRDGTVRIDAQRALSDEIWTYSRVPGRRLVLPWSADGCPDGSVQLDFVFGEKLPTPAEPVELWFAGAAPTTIRAATPELSLAWKVLWLVTDWYPQSKDLYDAVLLAEAVSLPYPLLRDVLSAEWSESDISAGLVTNGLRRELADSTWEDFPIDFPDTDTSPEDLVQRLLTALEPTFAEAPDATAS